MKKIFSLLLAVVLILASLTYAVSTTSSKPNLIKKASYSLGNKISYTAQDKALEALKSNDDVKVEYNDNIVFAPTHDIKETGFIFYPGAFVDPAAYAPIMQGLAQKGYKSIIAPMPVNFALLNINKGESIIDNNEDIKQWVIGGHSLGGVSAAKYAVKNNKIKGIVFFASYPQGDELKDTNLKVLSLYGSNDGVATPDNVQESIAKLPTGSVFIEITGGNHSQFGDYGHQSGDGTSTISPEDQWSQSINETEKLLKNIN